MRTPLPTAIVSVEEAKQFLKELHENGESFHPEDDAHSIVWQTSNPTPQERDHLNKLMSDIYDVADFDPCGYLLDLVNSPTLPQNQSAA